LRTAGSEPFDPSLAGNGRWSAGLSCRGRGTTGPYPDRPELVVTLLPLMPTVGVQDTRRCSGVRRERRGSRPAQEPAEDPAGPASESSRAPQKKQIPITLWGNPPTPETATPTPRWMASPGRKRGRPWAPTDAGAAGVSGDRADPAGCEREHRTNDGRPDGRFVSRRGICPRWGA